LAHDKYFEGIVCDFKIYEQNSSGTTGKGKHKSANQATKAPKATNSGIKLPPLQQQQLPKTTIKTRLPLTFATPHKRKPAKWQHN
jgi:hypothetical protein